MGSIEEKLRRGFELITRSEGDSDLLGVALLVIHSALEDHFRAVLLARTNLRTEDRQLVASPSMSWLTLINLVELYVGLEQEQRRVLVEANTIRQSFIAGQPFRGQVKDMLRFGRFAELLCNRKGLLEQVIREHQAEREPPPSPPPSPPRETSADPIDGEYADPDLSDRARTGVSITSILLIAIFIVVLYGAWFLFERVGGNAVLSAVGLAPTSTAVANAPVAPAQPVPTPAQRARVVGLGSGTGWLHERPDFSSRTLPIPLAEGMRVTLLDQEQVDAAGVRWMYVSAGGYDGWCPAENLDLGTGDT